MLAFFLRPTCSVIALCCARCAAFCLISHVVRLVWCRGIQATVLCLLEHVHRRSPSYGGAVLFIRLHLHVMMHKFSCLYLPFYFKIRINMLHKESDAHKLSTHMVVPSAANTLHRHLTSSIDLHMWHKSYRNISRRPFFLCAFAWYLLHEVHTNQFHIRVSFRFAASSRSTWHTNKQWKNLNVTFATNFHPLRSSSVALAV